jgi:hypothetical protein
MAGTRIPPSVVKALNIRDDGAVARAQFGPSQTYESALPMFSRLVVAALLHPDGERPPTLDAGAFGAVVRQEKNECVFKIAVSLERVDHDSKLVIEIVHHGGIDLHLAGFYPLGLLG